MSARLISSQGGHSTKVILHLLVGGGTVPVSQMGPDFLLLDQPFDHPPGDARVVMRVDESERVWDIHLPQGISSASRRVAISAGP